jgi:hypothetical protein
MAAEGVLRAASRGDVARVASALTAEVANAVRLQLHALAYNLLSADWPTPTDGARLGRGAPRRQPVGPNQITPFQKSLVRRADWRYTSARTGLQPGHVGNAGSTAAGKSPQPAPP